MDTQGAGAQGDYGAETDFYGRLTHYVHENVSPEFDPANDRLIEVLDSVGLLQLIMHIEQEFQIFLDPDSLSLEVFLNIESLSGALRQYEIAR